MAASESKLNLKHSMSVQEITERVQHAILLPTIDRAIVAIGVTGAGKSTLLNILAGKDAFEAAGGLDRGVYEESAEGNSALSEHYYCPY